MKEIPFATYFVDLRIIKTKIGEVVPINDIALALKLNFHELEDIINKDIRLYEGLIIKIDIELFHERALNNYGIVRLLTMLQLSYQFNADKNFSMKRLQEWTIEHLLNSPEEIPAVMNDQYESINELDFMKPKEASRVLGKSQSTIYRRIKLGKLKSYRAQSGVVLSREEVNRIASSYVVRNIGKDLS